MTTGGQEVSADRCSGMHTYAKRIFCKSLDRHEHNFLSRCDMKFHKLCFTVGSATKILLNRFWFSIDIYMETLEHH